MTRVEGVSTAKSVTGVDTSETQRSRSGIDSARGPTPQTRTLKSTSNIRQNSPGKMHKRMLSKLGRGKSMALLQLVEPTSLTQSSQVKRALHRRRSQMAILQKPALHGASYVPPFICVLSTQSLLTKHTATLLRVRRPQQFRIDPLLHPFGLALI